MCGICGVVNFDGSPVDPRMLRRMTDAIAHRGPDGEGWYRDRGVGLGHRRLAILDLSPAGHQPMITPDGRFALTYNGEIYNFRKIRLELEQLGHKFVSNTDSEVVLEAWAEWGSDAVLRFNGMFAFAIWDCLEQELTLVRDRYGIKPLYYANLSDVVLFGSEQRALLQHPAVGKRLDKYALVEYLTFQNILSDRTFNSDIRILPAGHMLRVRKGNSEPKLVKYWDFQFQESSNASSSRDLEDELESLIRQAVSRQLRSDVEVGSYLSGGLDSGTLTTLAVAENPALRTFTCGFDTANISDTEAHYDERIAARTLADQLGTTHSEIVVGQVDLEATMNVVAVQLEEPRVGQSYPNYLIAALASKSVKVVLSGAGGDELFAGYPWRYSAAAENVTPQAFRDHYFDYWNRLIPRSEMSRVLAPIWNEVKDYDPRDVFDSVINQHCGASHGQNGFLNDCLYFEAKTFLHGLFVVEDKLSMAHSMETRLPFLDDEVVEFAMRCPVTLKINKTDTQRDGKSNNSEVPTSKPEAFQDGKLILRKVLRRIAGNSVASRPKQGFSAPDTIWISNVTRERLLPLHGYPTFEAIFDDQWIRDISYQQHPSSKNQRLLLWSLSSVQTALNQFDL
jgi:asparagine synthase (glutamine-hydrolysing)